MYNQLCLTMYENVGNFITLNAFKKIFYVTERQYNSDVQALHNNLLQQLLHENAPKKDAVDSFLEQVGDILRRLSYLRRRQIQIELLQLVHRAEDEELVPLREYGHIIKDVSGNASSPTKTNRNLNPLLSKCLSRDS